MDNLFDWGFIRKCIQTHEAITGKKPSHIQIPTPPEFKILDVFVTVHTDPAFNTITCDHDRCLYHNKAIHPPKLESVLTPIK